MTRHRGQQAIFPEIVRFQAAHHIFDAFLQLLILSSFIPYSASMSNEQILRFS